MVFRLDNKKKILLVIIIVAVIAVVQWYVREEVTAFTAKDYEGLTVGMSERAVTIALGKRSKLIYENTRNDGVLVSAYMWTNPDGSFVEARFENGKLKQKTERGLFAKDK
ncbi:hypothetical protein ACQKK5_07805 [Brevibacillus panacihumi]|uniref:hypothetical protein n=1 Tax=Brevibacillus panacihumi TaxID=497735 RepID=UPI003CFC260A